MEYKKINCENYNLHLIKTDKFRTTNVRLCLRNEIKKEEIALRNFLSSFLTYSSETYPTKREMVLKAQDLYAVNIYNKTYRSGKYNMFNICLSMLNEKYTEPGMYEKTFEFLSNIIFKPNFNNEEDFKVAYDFIKEASLKNLKGIKENKALYSTVRMMEEMDKNMCYGYREFGYIEDLEKITKESLINYYNKTINDSIVDIYVIGNIDFTITENLIKKYFKFTNNKKQKTNQLIEHNKIPKRIKRIKEKDDTTQSKLSIGCKIDKLDEFERNYVLTLYNLILGGGSESKFFQIIREKHSLAYYVYSSLNKLDSLMLIRAGISRDNYPKTMKLIYKLMKDMELGKFSDEDINLAKENYISLLKEIEDNQDAIIETYLAKEILNLENIEERKKEIMKVTKSDIIRVAKKVKIDTVFLLEGVLDE